MGLAQIVNGTIDPNWVLTIVVGITAFLLLRLLNRIEKRLEVHDNKLAGHDTEIAVMKEKMKEL